MEYLRRCCRSGTWVGDFYFADLDLGKFPDLSFLIKIVLTLSHGQAAVERSFSVNNSVLNLNMKEDSIVAKKIVKDHMIFNSLKPYTIAITNQLIRSVSAARQKYQESLATSIKVPVTKSLLSPRN